MGESYFYLKAIFPTEEKAKEIFEEFKDFLTENEKAGEEWQKIRNEYNKSVLERYNYLKNKYKNVFNNIREKPDEKDVAMNFLAGELFEPLEKYKLVRRKNIIYLKALVWHLASWDNLCEWLIKKGGKAGWINEEFTGDYTGANSIFEIIPVKGIEETIIDRC